VHDERLYAERLTAPWWLWLVSTVVAATLGFAFGVPLGVPVGIATWVVAQALVAYVLISAAALVALTPDGLVAGRATLPYAVMGAVAELDDRAAAALRGRDADPRAYLLLRPWISRAVRVDLEDPRDPAPYWYVSTRRGAVVATALEQARAGAGQGPGPAVRSSPNLGAPNLGAPNLGAPNLDAPNLDDGDPHDEAG
jgi:hypothetical protein